MNKAESKKQHKSECQMLQEKIKIYIDNNVWDLLWKFNVNLNVELPHDEFEIFITGEAKFEFAGMPIEIKEYAQQFMNARKIRIDDYFGFYNSSLPEGEQRNGGFGSELNPQIGGRFATPSERDFLQKESSSISIKKMKTGLFKHEADVSLGARSLIAIVLTGDKRAVLKRARTEWSGSIIDVKEFDGSVPFGFFLRKELINQTFSAAIE
ncbi:MAG: hypothetical protein Q7T03_03990 [Deltaproteobacteria bacterium]|nr:hypothetical protein [Deltaproteobacteria bacterium]